MKQQILMLAVVVLVIPVQGMQTELEKSSTLTVYSPGFTFPFLSLPGDLIKRIGVTVDPRVRNELGKVCKFLQAMLARAALREYYHWDTISMWDKLQLLLSNLHTKDQGLFTKYVHNIPRNIFLVSDTSQRVKRIPNLHQMFARLALMKLCSLSSPQEYQLFRPFFSESLWQEVQEKWEGQQESHFHALWNNESDKVVPFLENSANLLVKKLFFLEAAIAANNSALVQNMLQMPLFVWHHETTEGPQMAYAWYQMYVSTAAHLSDATLTELVLRWASGWLKKKEDKLSLCCLPLKHYIAANKYRHLEHILPVLQNVLGQEWDSFPHHTYMLYAILNEQWLCLELLISNLSKSMPLQERINPLHHIVLYENGFLSELQLDTTPHGQAQSFIENIIINPAFNINETHVVSGVSWPEVHALIKTLKVQEPEIFKKLGDRLREEYNAFMVDSKLSGAYQSGTTDDIENYLNTALYLIDWTIERARYQKTLTQSELGWAQQGDDVQKQCVLQQLLTIKNSILRRLENYRQARLNRQ